MAMYGRHGEAPLPIVASYSPSHCFDGAIEAARIALKYRTPVILLSDGYLANGSEPWKLPDVDTCPTSRCRSPPSTNHVNADGNPGVLAVPARPRHLARPWADPRHAGPDAPHRWHREGGRHGNINYTPANHEHMVHLRAAKVAGIANDIPPVEVTATSTPTAGPRLGLDLGAIDARPSSEHGRRGHKVAQAHLTHLNPFPPTSATS
jgi:2-oxoglutarate ferredoxin oxidoreductase subunit alpha